MTAERWALLKSLFDQALSVAESQQANFVENVCHGDDALKRSLFGLLQHHEVASSVLQGPLLTVNRMEELVQAGLRTFLPGELVAGRFQILRFLAEGGMGEVYSARDQELDEVVALKTIRPALARNDQALLRFKQEIQLARRVTHKNVARVFDLYRHTFDLENEDKTILFLSMEFLACETLAERLHRAGPLPLDLAEIITAQLVGGLDAAHAAGVSHRDLKPANIALVSCSNPPAEQPDRAVIMDFGLAGTLSEAGPIKHDGMFGTPAYIAPEQINSSRVGPPADIYALGVVLFEMLTGTLPFRSTTAEGTARLRLELDAPLLRTVRPGVPECWERVVRACLQRDPDARPNSGTEVLRLLHYLPPPPSRRLAWTLAILALFSLGAVVYQLQKAHQPPPAAQAALESARVKLVNITGRGFTAAIQDYRQAVTLDPNWSLAWAELAFAYATGANAKQVPPAVAIKESRIAAQRAIQLESRSSSAYGALGWVQSLDFDEWPRAEASLRRAIELNSNDPLVHYWLGVHLRKKRDYSRAEAEDRLALSLSHRADPSIWCELAFLFWTSGQLQKMEQVMNDLLVAYPNFGFTRFLHARLLKENGRFDEALAELSFSERLQYSPVTILAESASVDAYRGDPAGAHKKLDRLTLLSQTQPVDGLLIAGVFARLGEFNTALDWLDRGYQQRDSTLLSLLTSPVLQPLRPYPRFHVLLGKLHYPQHPV